MSPPPEPDDASLRRRSWSRYWASGALTSLPEDFRANYDGEIREFWRERCAGLDDGAAILDVCTGNGAVALLVAEAMADRERSARLTAVDLADIHPELVRARFPALAHLVDGIRFVGGRPFEAIALEEASQDLIVSQYGIEYCEPDAAAAQCARLLKPGAELALITHAPDSDMRATMQAELDQFDRLQQLGLADAVRAWADEASDGGALREALARCRDALRREAKLASSGLYRYALGLAEQGAAMTDAQLEAQKAALVEAVEQLEDGRSRLDQMLEVNRRLADLDAWAGRFEAVGLESIDRGRLRYRNRHEVGRWLRFVRA